ncbi:MAG: hypothetical protein A4E52_01650 [Pelotomaculum sp. PtaB.Bin013]|nr:MAG: hypothetical protein A4E52_01650 [Pelotomaculum sp. PtaB.Bin013]
MRKLRIIIVQFPRLYNSRQVKRVKPVKLQDIIDEMEMQMDECHKYLNTETGEIITVSSEELGIAEESEEDDDFSEYPDWQRDSVDQALDVVMNWGNGKYIELPDKWDIHEYSIIEAFCGSVSNDRISNALYSAIQGRGAFRRFKDAIRRYDIEDSWYKFRDEAFKKLAVEWCEENNIPNVET